MEKKTFITVFIFIIVFVAIVLISNRTYKIEGNHTQGIEAVTSVFDGKECFSLECIADRFVRCSIGSYENSGTYILIYGLVDNKCHVKVQKETTKICYLSRSNLTIPLLNQLLGNKERLEDIIQTECE